MSVLSATAQTLPSAATTSTSRSGEAVQGVGTVRVVKAATKPTAKTSTSPKDRFPLCWPADQSKPQHPCRTPPSPVGAGVGSPRQPQQSARDLVAQSHERKDKLSWLILNRASSGSDGDNATLSAAASALLAGQVNDRIGLVDDLGFTSKTQPQRSKQASSTLPNKS